jgi:hypothetical protein
MTGQAEHVPAKIEKKNHLKRSKGFEGLVDLHQALFILFEYPVACCGCAAVI